MKFESTSLDRVLPSFVGIYVYTGQFKIRTNRKKKKKCYIMLLMLIELLMRRPELKHDHHKIFTVPSLNGKEYSLLWNSKVQNTLWFKASLVTSARNRIDPKTLLMHPKWPAQTLYRKQVKLFKPRLRMHGHNIKRKKKKKFIRIWRRVFIYL